MLNFLLLRELRMYISKSLLNVSTFTHTLGLNSFGYYIFDEASRVRRANRLRGEG